MPPPPKKIKRYFDNDDSTKNSFKFNVKDNDDNHGNTTSRREGGFKDRRNNYNQKNWKSEKDEGSEHNEDGGRDDSQPENVESSSEKKKAREYHKDAKLKQFRLIIRNLPFKTKKENLQNVCSNFGPFSEIVLPPSKKMEGRCAGFAFIQFMTRDVATKAKEHFNNNKFMGRMVAADWALDKDTYETNSHEEKKTIKSKVKEEKEEPVEDVEAKEPISEISENIENQEKKNYVGKSKVDMATQEERVVFLRNLSFETDEDTLKSEASKFGEVQLAIMCKFKDSGHSKGTAFIHFANKTEAADIISASDKGDVVIDGRNINVILAVPREKAMEIEKEAQKKIPSDNRNLRLLRFSLIREGTSAAAGMSSEDAAKRVRFAELTRKKLENLHMFVSPVRMVVHNLPANMTEAKLREICKDAGGEGASITECRIWKDPERLNNKGEPKSKGFAFVTFTEHTHALKSLQKLNNNPKTFTNEKRPIVEFSIENIAALQAKERRKSQSKGESVNVKQLNETVRKQVQESIGKIHMSGMKFLPKLVGKKMRHRNMSTNKKKKLGLIKKDKKTDSSSVVQKNKKKSARRLINLPSRMASKFYDFTVKDANQSDIKLGDKYKGKVVVVMNVASQCGYTNSNYTQMKELLDKYKPQGFEVAAFPCNQFGGQEPACEIDIKNFVQNKFNFEPDLYAKIDVNGKNADPLYDYLKKEQGGVLLDAIKWNFTKFLVNRSGKVIQRYGPNTEPKEMIKDIEAALKDEA